MFKKVVLLAAVCAPMLATSASATDVTGSLDVQATIVASCLMTVGSNIDFGSTITSLSSPVTNGTSVDVDCSTGTPYKIGISNGGNYSIVQGRRLYDGTANYVLYDLFVDAGYATTFPNIGPVSNPGGTGPGNSHTVFARIPSQTTPVNGTYTDTVVVTVRY